MFSLIKRFKAWRLSRRREVELTAFSDGLDYGRRRLKEHPEEYQWLCGISGGAFNPGGRADAFDRGLQQALREFSLASKELTHDQASHVLPNV